jgi:hypothetical protein
VVYTKSNGWFALSIVLNPKLRRVLKLRGFVIKHFTGIGEVDYHLNNLHQTHPHPIPLFEEEAPKA